MKKRVKTFMQAVTFLLVAALFFEGVSAMCRRSSWAPVVTPESGYDAYSKLNHLTGFPVDVVAFGASKSACSVVPLQLYEQYGISAYNISGSQQPMMASYLILEEYLRWETPKIVLLEAAEFFETPAEKWYRLSFDGLPLSEAKWTVIKQHSENKSSESLFSYVFDIYKYHSGWNNLKEYGFSASDPAKDRYLHYGYRIKTKILDIPEKYKEFQGWVDGETDRVTYTDENYEYACMFLELCQKAGIEVILYKDLVTELSTITWSLEKHNTIQDFADFYEVSFIDFNMNDVFLSSGMDFSTDFADANHLNPIGAKKVTQYLGKYLNENYDLPDHRNDPQYKDMEMANARFQRILLGEHLVLTNNMADYLDQILDLDGQDYTVFFSVRNDCQRKLDDDLKTKLTELGFVPDKVFEEHGHSLIGIWQNGKMIYEKSSKGTRDIERDALEYKGELPDGMKYYVKSAGYYCGNVSSIVIDGTEYSKNGRGFNIVVYDNINGWVVDSIVFDTYKDAGVTYSR